MEALTEGGDVPPEGLSSNFFTSFVIKPCRKLSTSGPSNLITVLVFSFDAYGPLEANGVSPEVEPSAEFPWIPATRNIDAKIVRSPVAALCLEGGHNAVEITARRPASILLSRLLPFRLKYGSTLCSSTSQRPRTSDALADATRK